jgi:2-methylisocitrate lyase-like PEP mutase family enzyme
MMTPFEFPDGHADARPEHPARTFRHMLESKIIQVMAGSFNASSARVLHEAGITCSLLGGSGVSNTFLGLPDSEFLSLTQLASVCNHITSAVPMPILVDADTGYGNAINLAHAVHLFEKAGAAGIMFEDQVAPKRSGHIAGKRVVSIEEMVGKVKSAVAARSNPDLVLVARCDARAVEGPDGAIARANAYAAAGADATMVDGAVSLEELARFGSEIKSRYRIVNLGGSAKVRTTPKPPIAELQAMGYNVAMYALQSARASALGMLRYVDKMNSEQAGSGPF